MTLQELTIKVIEHSKDIEWMKIAIFGLYGYIPLVQYFKPKKKKGK